MSTTNAKPPVALEAKINGNLFTDNNGVIAGTMKIDDAAEFAMTIDPAPQKSKDGNTEFWKFSAAKRENGETSAETAFSGVMFKTRTFGQIGKAAIRLTFEDTYKGARATFNIVGFYKNTKADGSAAKAPFYSLSNDKPLPPRS